MLFDVRVLEFKVMDTMNIYEILHLLILIKIKHNMDFGGIWHLHIYATKHIHFFLFLSKGSGEIKASLMIIIFGHVYMVV